MRFSKYVRYKKCNHDLLLVVKPNMPFKTLSDLADSKEFVPLVGNGTSHYNLLKVHYVHFTNIS